MKSNKCVGMVRHLLSRAVNTLLAPAGLTLVRLSKLQRDPWSLLSLLSDVQTVIDVGVGDAGSVFLYRHFPNARYFSVDPLEECREVVRTLLPKTVAASEFFPIALGAAEGEAALNVASKLSRSSIMERAWKPDTSFEAARRRTVPVRRLDSVLENANLSRAVLLKIDTEGFELEVLKGATGLLRNIDYLLLEISTTENYAGSYRISDIFAWVYDHGFHNCFVCQSELVFTNVVFFRQGTAVAKHIGVEPPHG